MADVLEAVILGASRSSGEFSTRADESRVSGSDEPPGPAIGAGTERQQRWMASVHAAPLEFTECAAEPPNRFSTPAQQQPVLVGASADVIAQRWAFRRIFATAAQHEAADR